VSTYAFNANFVLENKHLNHAFIIILGPFLKSWYFTYKFKK